MSDDNDTNGPLGLLLERNPDALRLARLLSTAVRIEPELVRHARLRLLPHSDVGAEADLWSSGLLASSTVLALTFKADIAIALRSQLAGEPPDVREGAIALVEALHRKHHWSHRLEEALHALDVRGDQDADRQREQLLLAAIGQLHGIADGHERRAIARWLLGAYARLAPASRTSDEAAAASLAAGYHLDGRIATPGTASQGLESEWMPWLTGSTTPARARVSFSPDAVVLQRVDVASTVAPRGDEITLPDSKPPVVDLSGSKHPGTRRYQLPATAPLIIPFDGDEAVLSALDGARFTARRPGSPSPSGHDFGVRRAELRPCLEREDLVNDVCKRLESGVTMITVGGPEGIGKSVVLNAVIDNMLARNAVMAWHFYDVRPTWNDLDSVVASLESQLRTALPDLPPVPDHPSAAARFGSVLSRAGEYAAKGDVRRILLVIDGVPGESDGEVTNTIAALHIPAQVPIGIQVLVSTRHPAGIREALSGIEDHELIDLSPESAERVCRAMINRSAATLRLAFGLTAIVPAQTHGAETMAQSAESPARLSANADADLADRLIERVGGNPGRLARLLAWVAEQVPGTATLRLIPVTFTVALADVWLRVDALGAELGVPHPNWLGWVLVALPGFTMNDFLRLLNDNAITSSRAPDSAVLGAIPELVRVVSATGDGEVAQVEATDPSVVEAFRRRFGPAAIKNANADHANHIRPTNVDRASDYQIRSAVRHHVAAEDVEGAIELLLHLPFLSRRYSQDGTVALTDDIDLVVRAGGGDRKPALRALRRAVDGIGGYVDAEPSLFGSLLLNEYLSQGGPSEHLPSPAAPAALLERVIDVGVAPAAWTLRAEEPLAALTDRGELIVASRGKVFQVRGGLVTATFPGLANPYLYASNSSYHAVADLGSMVVFDDSHELTTASNDQPSALIGFEDGFASGHADGTVMIHRARPDGWHRSFLVGHSDRVSVLAGAGELLLSGSADGTVRRWHPDGRQTGIYRGHHGPVDRLVVLDNDRVASADTSGLIRVWNATTGADIDVVSGHRGPITCMLPYLLGLITTGSDGVVQRWSSSQDRTMFQTKGYPIVGAALDGPNDPHLLTAEPDGTLRWWDPKSGLELAVFAQSEVRGTIHQVLTDPGGGVVIIDDDGVTSIPPQLTAQSNPHVARQNPRASWLSALLVDVTGATATVGVPDGLCTYNLSSGAITGRERYEDADRPVALARTPFGTGRVTLTADGILRIGSEAVRATDVRLLAADSIGEKVSVCTGDGKVRTVSSETEILLETELIRGIEITALTRDGVLLAVAGNSNVMVFSELRSGAQLLSQTTVESMVTDLALVGPSRCIIGCSNGSVLRWDYGKSPELMGSHHGPVTGVIAVASRGSDASWMAVSASPDGLLRLWDVESADLVGAVAVPAGAEAMASGGGRIVGRLSNGELWVLAAGSAPRHRGPAQAV